MLQNLKKFVVNKLGNDAPIAILLVAVIAVVCVLGVFSIAFINFQFGADIPYLDIKNSGPAAYWGQIGDFIGGILNPILSFLAFMAVIYSLRLQSQEVKSARDEAKTAQSIQQKQSDILDEQRKIFERQRFESVFFGLLEIHSRNVVYANATIDHKVFTGLDVFSRYAAKYNVGRIDGVVHSGGCEKNRTLLEDKVKEFDRDVCFSLGHYFRVLEELLDYLDSYGQANAWQLKLGETIFGRFMKNNQPEVRERYGRIVRSTLSTYELECVFMYGLTPAGEKLKSLVEKFAILKNFPQRSNFHAEGIKSIYSESAYGLSLTNESMKDVSSKADA